MIYYALGSFSIVLFNIILWILILSNKRRDKVVWSYILWSAAVSGWALGYGITLSGWFDRPTTLFWNRFCHANASFIGIFFLQLAFALTNQLNIRKKYMLFMYSIGLSLLALDFTPLFVKDLWQMSFFKYQPLGGPFYIYFTAVFFYTILNALWVLYRRMKEAIGNEQQQLKIFLIGTIIGYAGGATLFLQAHRLNILPIGVFFISFYVLFTGYAIYKYGFMNIEVLIKKTLVFASLFTIVFGIFVGVTLLLQQLIGGASNIIGLAISSLIIIFTVRPLEMVLVRITDKYLFQKKYDYKHLIREFMDELKTMVLNTTDIAQSTVDFLNTSIRPVISAVFMYNRFTSQYDLIASSDFKNKDLKIAGSSEFVKILGDTGKIVTIKNNNRLMLSQESTQLISLGIELIVPLLIHKELIGFVCLGKKKSDEDYLNDDTEALSDLSGALSISLNNAQLFDERADAEKRALVGTIATGINHEVGNPLNIITIKLDTFRILAKEGLLAHKTKEEIIEEVNKITKVCLDSAQRIAEITRQVSEFAKPDKKLIFGKVGISEAIDETIAFLKHGMILDSEKIEKRIVCEPAYVLADRGQLKQILFNLIKNASHAIDKEKGRIIVKVDKNNNGEIAVKIIDNGHGMPKEVRDKVFTPFFTTKEPGRGTGLGLALVKIMIDRNNAKIKVESEEGEGTTFTLIFKGGLL